MPLPERFFTRTNYPPDFKAWHDNMFPPEWRDTLDAGVLEEAYRIWHDRGGGISSESQSLADLNQAQQNMFEKYAPKPNTS